MRLSPEVIAIVMTGLGLGGGGAGILVWLRFPREERTALISDQAAVLASMKLGAEEERTRTASFIERLEARNATLSRRVEGHEERIEELENLLRTVREERDADARKWQVERHGLVEELEVLRREKWRVETELAVLRRDAGGLSG